jgi:hypothetical protein
LIKSQSQSLRVESPKILEREIGMVKREKDDSYIRDTVSPCMAAPMEPKLMTSSDKKLDSSAAKK